MYRSGQRSGRIYQPGVLILLMQLLGDWDAIPHVTLALVLGQAALYVRLIDPGWRAWDVAVNAYLILEKKDWKRLLIPAFEHGDDMHLFYNMASLIVKGKSLERSMGSYLFAKVVLMFAVLTNAVLVAMSMLLMRFLEEPFYYYHMRVIGFSGVLFALKVLTTYDPAVRHSMVSYFGLVFPMRYAVWVELLVIQLLVPNASFLGHLAGVIVGLAYVKTPWLRKIVEAI